MRVRKLRRLNDVQESLPDEEWNFSRCSDQELVYCCYYEYARMDDKLKTRVAQLSTSGSWGLGFFPGDSVYYPDAWFRNFFRRLPSFPDLPWLKTKESHRREACSVCEQIQGPFVSVGPERYFNEEKQYPYFPPDVGPFELRSVHAVEVDWTASDDAILAAFIRWRDVNRPAKDVVLESRGRGGARELLKFLGAYRLMHRFGNNSVLAADWVDNHAPTAKTEGRKADGVPRYSDEANWRKAAQKAKRIIDKGIWLTPAGMLEGKLKASNMSTVQQARVKISIEQAKRADRGQETAREAEQMLDKAKKAVMQELGLSEESAKSQD